MFGYILVRVIGMLKERLVRQAVMAEQIVRDYATTEPCEMRTDDTASSKDIEKRTGNST